MTTDRTPKSADYWRGYKAALNAVRSAGWCERAAQAVHRSWRDGMLKHDRDVAEPRLRWETLSTEDKELDEYIARRVALALELEARRVMAEMEDEP